MNQTRTPRRLTGRHLCWTVVATLAFHSSLANAYLDPGTGSLVLQGLIAGIAATMFAIRTYWYKLKSFFGKSGRSGLLGDVDAEDASRPADASPEHKDTP